MVKNLYCIFDKNLERYNDPGYDVGDKEIMVNLKRAMYDKESPLYKFAEDYDCYCLGSFDDKTGIIMLEHEPRLVCHLLSLKGE